MKTILKGVFVVCLAIAFNAAASTPLITSEPQSITINNASTANFTVVATNAATYQWLVGTNAISGATSSTLTLDNVTSNQAGFYSVVVTSSTGDATNSLPAQLTIIPGTIVQITVSTFPSGGSRSFLVQLFDNDKSATVENFIHYITSGSFSNMFFERCVPGFVLQGGSYVTTDRTSSGLNYSHLSTGTNVFPGQLDSEFNVGPFIPNTFGTLAMALAPGEPNSASSAFFINLADNSATLDGANGDFTVFGRILSGANTLQYFNTLSAPASGIFDLNSGISTLPVDDDGTNAPGDVNLFYCDFEFQTPPPVDTVPPRVAITNPVANSAFLVGSSVNVTGVASDNVGLAEVYVIASGITGFYEGQSETNAATGTTNWSWDFGSLPAGIYELQAFSQDGEGNLSETSVAFFTNCWQLTVITNVEGNLTTNTQLVVPGQQYSVTATPGPGELFEYWQNNGVETLNPVQSFTPETNITVTVTLVSNNLPAGLAITSPAAGASVQATTTGNVTISGILPAANITQVTCQLFSQSNAVTPALSASLSGGNWSVVAANLQGGPYTVIVVAEDSSGRQGLVTENFTVLFSPPNITTQPGSITVNAGSTAAFTVAANNVATYQWQLGSQAIAGATNASLILENVSTNQAGSYSVVMTSPVGDSLVSQAAQLTVIPGTMVQLTFSGYSAGGPSNVVLQLFDHDKPATVQNFLHYIASGAYSNMFWTRCVPGFVLQGGDYVSSDRTNGAPPHLSSVTSTFTDNSGLTPPFPSQVDNEYSVGPLIPNTFGTIAMAKTAGDPDSANNTFFFNLADNSDTLDNTNSGGFAVFGRIVSGAGVLDYFNTFPSVTILDRISSSSGPTNCLFNSGSAPFDALPVNYYGLNTPGDSNFFYVDFTLLTTPVLDTNPPSISVTYPAASATATNAHVVVSGTAVDDVGIAFVYCSVSGPAFTGNYAIGATNWAVDCGNLAPGTYTLYARGQDGAGNLSDPVETTFVVPQSPVSISSVGPGKLSQNLTQANTVAGSNYVIKAEPSAGALFVNWTDGTNVTVNATDSFTMPNGLQLTATFVQNTLPNGVTFTYPAANASLHTSSVALAGTVSKTAGSTMITCRIFSKTTGASIDGPMTTTSSGAWSLPPVQLAPGSYIAQALATNSAGKTTVITQNFSVLAPLTVNIIGPGKTSITNGAYLQSGATYTIKATPSSAGYFYSWSDPSGTAFSSSASFSMSKGLSITATFVPNSLAKLVSFTYPAANATLATNTFQLTGSVSASVSNPQVVFQLFSSGSPVTGLEYATVNGQTWSIPMTALREGSYTAIAIASDSAGRQTLLTESFKVNVYPTIEGTYYGVFFNTNNITTNTAGFFALTLSGSGSVSGTLQFPFTTYKLTGFPLGSTGGLTLPGYFQNTEVLVFNMQFDLTNGSDTVTGYVDSLASGTVAYYTGYRAVTKLPANTPAGKYVVSMETITNEAASGPANDGYATLTVGATGSLALAGTLADNTTFTEGAGVSRSGVWPVYAKLYNGHGFLVGWETNVTGTSGAAGSIGTVYWAKAPTADTYYTNGFTIAATSSATNYIAPVAGTLYQAVFSGATISPSLTNSLTVSKSAQFAPATGAADKLAITLSTAGAITGSIYNPATGEKLTVSGTFANPAIGGSGFVFDPSGQTTDSFQITLVP